MKVWSVGFDEFCFAPPSELPAGVHRTIVQKISLEKVPFILRFSLELEPTSISHALFLMSKVARLWECFTDVLMTWYVKEKSG